MTRPDRKSVAILASTWAVAVMVTVGQADEFALIAPTEFETGPLVVLHGVVDVLSVAVPQQGEHMFVALHDGSVMVLDRTSRKPVRLVKCHDGLANDLGVSDSCDLLVTVGGDAIVKTWRLPGFELASTMSGHSGRVIAIAISADGHTIASCGSDKTVRIWSAESGIERGLLPQHNSTVRSVAFSPDGTTLASAGDDGIVRLWNVRNLNDIGTRTGHAGRVRSVEFSPDGKVLASAGEDGCVLLWNAADADAEPRALTHGAMILSVAFSPHGSLLASGDSEGTIHLWNLETDRMPTSLEGHTDAVTSLKFATDSRTLFSSSHDGTINAWSAKQPPHPALATVKVDAGKVWAMAVSPDGSRVAVGGHRGFVSILDLNTGRQITELQEKHPATVDCLEYSPDGLLIATASWRSDEIIVWRAVDGGKEKSFKADGNIRAIEFSPDGKRIAAGCEDKQLIIWDVGSGVLVGKVNAHGQPVYDVSFSPDGETIVTCSGNWAEAKPGQIKLWRADSLAEITRLEGHNVAVRSAIFNPDGNRLASVSEDGLIRIWDVKTQTEIAVLRNSCGARALDWSPDGKLLAAGLHDGTTNVWELHSGTVARRFGGNADTFSVRFVPDGSVLCGVGGAAAIIFWDTSDLTGNDASGRIAESVQKWRNKVR